MWYVIQTQTGKEENTKQKIETILPKELYEECMVLYYESKRKYEGKWHIEKKVLFPGYLFIVTEQPEEVFLGLKNVPELTKLLGYDKDFVPISKEEEAFLKRICGTDQTAAMSYGIQEGDRIIVKEGVLKGLESRIRRLDRHKRWAIIEMEFMGDTREVKIGLEILRKI